jgi:predicted AAA+ superfamily ATPase
LPPWTPNLTKREAGRSKTILLDSGLALRAVRMTSAQLLATENLQSFGGFLESFAAGELMRQRTWSTLDYDLFHYRDRDGLEVDLIIEAADAGIIGIEIKASTSFRGDHFTALRTLRDRLGSRFLAGFVLNTGQIGYHHADRIYGLPLAALWGPTPRTPPCKRIAAAAP